MSWKVLKRDKRGKRGIRLPTRSPTVWPPDRLDRQRKRRARRSPIANANSIANSVAIFPLPDRRRALQLDRQRKRQRRSPTVWPKLNR